MFYFYFMVEDRAEPHLGQNMKCSVQYSMLLFLITDVSIVYINDHCQILWLTFSQTSNGHILIHNFLGFGDSSKAHLTENGLVHDCVLLFKWLRNSTTSSIYVWGQSLGSALCVETVHMLNKENIIPKGMILESSFTNLREAVLDSPAGKVSFNVSTY